MSDTDALLRAMTFNVRLDTERDGEQAWPARRERVASTIRFHRPAVVGLQEPLEHQFDFLREQLPGYDWVGVGRLDGESAGEYGPLGFDADRFDHVAHGTFWLSETPEVSGSKSWGASWPRMATWAVLDDSRTGRRLVACNTHFDHESERARVESARLVRTRLGDVVVDEFAGEGVAVDDVPVVLLGDFNCVAGSEPYDVLTADDPETGLRLFDAQFRSDHGHHGPSVTFNRFQGPTEKIDFVFVTGNAGVFQHGVVSETWDGGPPSDHAPVVADLRFGD